MFGNVRARAFCALRGALRGEQAHGGLGATPSLEELFGGTRTCVALEGSLNTRDDRVIVSVQCIRRDALTNQPAGLEASSIPTSSRGRRLRPAARFNVRE